jgi:uncharacterized sulfatase
MIEHQRGRPARGRLRAAKRPYRSTSRVVEFLDVYRTVADLVRLPAPANLQGHSLVPLLKDPQMQWDHPALTQVRRGSAASSYHGLQRPH